MGTGSSTPITSSNTLVPTTLVPTGAASLDELNKQEQQLNVQEQQLILQRQALKKAKEQAQNPVQRTGYGGGKRRKSKRSSKSKRKSRRK